MVRGTSSVALGLTLTLALGPVLPSRAEEAPRLAPELFLAIGHQDLAGLQALLSKGVGVESRNTLGMTGLMIAASTGNVEMVKALLAKGADINASSPFGSPLTFAAWYPNPATALYLLEQGAKIDARRPDGITTLMLAARNGSPELVKAILAKKAELDTLDNSGATALSHAARSGHAGAAELLLAAGARVNAADKDGWTPLMHAAVNGHAAAAKALLTKGADPKVRDGKGRTALLLAASYGDHPEAVRALLAGGAERDARDGKSRTALALAEIRGYGETAKVLKELGAETVTVGAIRTAREAAQIGLERVQQSTQMFVKRTGCVSCHHEGIGRVATAFAREHGFPVNEATDQEQEKRATASLAELKPLLDRAVADPAETKNVPIADIGDLVTGLGSTLLGMDEKKAAANPTVGAATMVIARMQTPEGDWRFGFQRVPIQSSYFTATALAVKAMRAYAPKQYADEIEGRLARAKAWLLSAPAPNAEDKVYRLLALKWMDASVEERKKAVEELRAAQLPDGGWAQLPGMGSDAYATGTALYALAQGAEVAAKDEAYQRGVAFLLRTQDDDGTWYVQKRAIPANNYFDTGYSFGQSQYISYAAGCWATIALIHASEGS